MTNYLKASLDDIIADAKENDRTDYLKSLGKKEMKKEDGGKRRITYLEIKRAYFSQYYPDQLPTAKKKTQSMYDKLANL